MTRKISGERDIRQAIHKCYNIRSTSIRPTADGTAAASALGIPLPPGGMVLSY